MNSKIMKNYESAFHALGLDHMTHMLKSITPGSYTSEAERKINNFLTKQEKAVYERTGKWYRLTRDTPWKKAPGEKTKTQIAKEEMLKRDTLKREKKLKILREKQLIRKTREKEMRDKRLFGADGVRRNMLRERRLREQSDGTLPITYSKNTLILQSLLEKQFYQCNNCFCDLTENNMELDHHIPLSKGGLHSIKNVVWLCHDCNNHKSDKIPSKELEII